MTLRDYERLLSDCICTRAGYTNTESLQYMAITAQIQGLKATVDYLKEKEAEKCTKDEKK